MIKCVMLKILVEEEVPLYGIYCYMHEITFRTTSGKRIVMMIDMNGFCNVSRDKNNHHIMIPEYVNFDSVIDTMMFDSDGGLAGVPKEEDWLDIGTVTEAKINAKFRYENTTKFGKRYSRGGKLTPKKILSIDIELGELEYYGNSKNITIPEDGLKDIAISGY